MSDGEVPLPLEIVEVGAAAAAMFGPDGPTPYTPLGSAMLFWQALLSGRDEYRSDLEILTYNPPAFGDYSGVEAQLAGYSMMERVDHPSGREDIGYVRFMRDTGHSMRAFADAPINDLVVLTMVSGDGEIWLVWGYSHNYIPSAAEIDGA